MMDKGLSTLPLAAVSSVLTALDADKDDIQLGPQGARALDTAGYESVSRGFLFVPVCVTSVDMSEGRRRRA